MEDPANEEETEIPIPLNTSFAHLLPNSSIITTNHNNGSSNYKRSSSVGIRYRECLKNHAANMGGNATDGCGEFMPSGEEGSIEALTCSACLCHRNFHRKENEGSTWFPHLNTKFLHHHTIISSRPAAIPQQMIMPYNLGPSMPSESDAEQEPPHPNHHHNHNNHNNNHQMIVTKRYRTKFTGEQKEKMLNFAEKVGWKIQKQEESFVQQFCQEIGVKRRVLKVWMHNNKHNLAKKSTTTIATTTITTASTNASLV